MHAWLHTTPLAVVERLPAYAQELNPVAGLCPASKPVEAAWRSHDTSTQHPSPFKREIQENLVAVLA